MVQHRVLLVDDQIEVRRVLRSGLETLGENLQILDVPSAEEAQLIISRQAVDLLISDIRLAGISGLELLKKVRKRSPQVKVILMTGMDDESTRRLAREAGAEAFFFKPVQMVPFLEAAATCLDLPHEVPPPSPISSSEAPTVPRPDLEEHTQTGSVAARLSLLRQELGLRYLAMFDREGCALEQSGDEDLGLDPQGLDVAIWKFISAGSLLSGMLETASPGASSSEGISLALGPYKVWAIPVGEELTLAALSPASKELNGPSEKGLTLSALNGAFSRAFARAAQEYLGEIFPVQEQGAASQDDFSTGEEQEEDSLEEEDLAAVLQSAAQIQLEPQDVVDFWETALEESAPGFKTADGLSFEQARRLGLTPEDCEED